MPVNKSSVKIKGYIMANKTNSMIMFFFVLATLSVLSWQTFINDVSAEQPPVPEPETAITTDWSKNATEAETSDLIKQAELLLQQTHERQSATTPSNTIKDDAREAALAILSTSRNTTVNLPTGPIETSDTPVAQVASQSKYLPGYNMPTQTRFNISSALTNWLPGAIALLLSCGILFFVRQQLALTRRAGRQASSLIEEAKDVQKNLKEWEQENHYNHINEISSHIEAMNDTIVTAREVKDSVDETIHKGVSLNQKSIEILKKANKELSKSLTNQVTELEQQLKNTVNFEIERINTLGQEQLSTFRNEKDSILSAVKQQTSDLRNQQATTLSSIEQQNHKLEDKQQSTTSMIDIITNELNSLKAQKTDKANQGNKSPQTPMASHADMLRESINRQREAISGSSIFNGSGNDISTSNNKQDTQKSQANSLASSLKSSSILNGLKDHMAPEGLSSNETAPATKKTTSVSKESTSTTSDGIAITTRDISTSKPTQAATGNKFTGIDNKELMDKLTHAEKWRNFKMAAEICEEMASRGTDKAEVFDVWGQMLARQASLEKGPDSGNILTEAAHKMQKASLLDNGNYKIFNNWGVILKNLALTCTNNQEMEKNLAIARRKFENSLTLNPKNHEALNNWGNTLLIQSRMRTGAMQESLLNSACEKFSAALELKPDKEVSLYSWGNALFKLANCKSDSNTRNKLLIQAQQRWEQANKIKPGIASKELRVLRSMVPPLNTKKPEKEVTDYKFKTLTKHS